MFRDFFFFFENLAVYVMICKSTVEPDSPKVTLWRMRIACWMPMATNSHPEYVIVIAFYYNSGYTNAPQCCGIRTLPVLL